MSDPIVDALNALQAQVEKTTVNSINAQTAQSKNQDDLNTLNTTANLHSAQTKSISNFSAALGQGANVTVQNQNKVLTDGFGRSSGSLVT